MRALRSPKIQYKPLEKLSKSITKHRKTSKHKTPTSPKKKMNTIDNLDTKVLNKNSTKKDKILILLKKKLIGGRIEEQRGLINEGDEGWRAMKWWLKPNFGSRLSKLSIFFLNTTQSHKKVSLILEQVGTWVSSRSMQLHPGEEEIMSVPEFISWLQDHVKWSVRGSRSNTYWKWGYI